MHALLLIEIVDHRRVLAGQLLELFFPSGIGKTARIEDKSAAVSRSHRPAFARWKVKLKIRTVKRSAEEARPCNFSDANMPWKASISAGRAMGSLDVMSQPAQVLQRVGHALQKMRLALIKAAETIGPQRLHDADVHVRVIVLHERCAIEVMKPARQSR